MRALALALIAGLSIVLTACGSGFHPLESAAIPDGHKEAKAPRTFSLTGSSIHIDQAGLSLIEGFEGWSSCPYWDAYGRVWTRGYGETDFGGNFHGVCISRSQGQSRLYGEVEHEYQWAVRALGVNFNHHQVDALDSFVWNLGAGIFTGTLRYDLQHRSFWAATRIMLLYDHAGGVVLEGLRIRRQREVALFLKPEAVNPAVLRAAREKALAADNVKLEVVRGELAHMRHLLLVYGCDRRIAHHKHLGPRCKAWLVKARAAHLLGLKLDGEVSVLERELRA